MLKEALTEVCMVSMEAQMEVCMVSKEAQMEVCMALLMEALTAVCMVLKESRMEVYMVSSGAEKEPHTGRYLERAYGSPLALQPPALPAQHHLLNRPTCFPQPRALRQVRQLQRKNKETYPCL